MTTPGPSSQATDMRHMYSFVDYSSSDEKKLYYPSDSISGIISSHPKMKKFWILVKKAKMNGQLAQPQANCTIFVPLDNELKQHDRFFELMDTGLAVRTLNASIMNRRIDKSILEASPVSYIQTRNPSARVYITNIDGVTKMNGNVQIEEFDIRASNGLIHTVNGLLTPSNDTFIN